MEPFIAQIVMFGGNFAPRGWAFCDGQLLPISQNTALFSLLGTTYGGDGRTTFALPDLRGRVPMHAGQGPGLTHRQLGERVGSEQVTLSLLQIPAHNHTLFASPNNGTDPSPINNFIGKHQVTIDRTNTVNGNSFTPVASGLGSMNGSSISNTGGSQPHTNVQPTLVINYIIALVGIFPSRN